MCFGVLAALLLPARAHAITNPQIPGLQVALKAEGVYAGPIDGIAGPMTARGVRRFQRRAGLLVDGVAGPRTRAKLGRLGKPLQNRGDVLLAPEAKVQIDAEGAPVVRRHLAADCLAHLEIG